MGLLEPHAGHSVRYGFVIIGILQWLNLYLLTRLILSFLAPPEIDHGANSYLLSITGFWMGR